LLWIRQYIIAGGAYDAHLMVRKLKKKKKNRRDQDPTIPFKDKPPIS
jgi:hypothetical protein